MGGTAEDTLDSSEPVRQYIEGSQSVRRRIVQSSHDFPFCTATRGQHSRDTPSFRLRRSIETREAFHKLTARTDYSMGIFPIQETVSKGAGSALRHFAVSTDSVHGCMMRKRLRLRRLETIVEHTSFRLAMLAVIFLNAVLIAVESSYAIHSSFVFYDSNGTELPSIPKWLGVSDHVFFGIYLVELLMRLFAHEGRFFVGSHWLWNLLDLTVVLFASVELTLVSGGSNSMMFRLVRLLRLTRSVRAMRLLRIAPALYPLQFMLLSCQKSLTALFWATLLLILLLFLFGVGFISVATEYVKDSATHSNEVVEDLRQHFRSVPIAMLTLFLSFVGEVDYKEVILTLFEVDATTCVVYVSFVLFVTLALSNIIAGIFITEAMETAGQDREIRLRGEQVRARKNMKMLSDLFHELDTTGTGQLNKKDFEQRMEDLSVQAMLSYFNFNTLDAKSFFARLDVDGSGAVDIEEFVVGCLRMHGKANAIDMEVSIHETKVLAKRIMSEVRKLSDLAEKAGSFQRAGTLIGQFPRCSECKQPRCKCVQKKARLADSCEVVAVV